MDPGSLVQTLGTLAVASGAVLALCWRIYRLIDKKVGDRLVAQDARITKLETDLDTERALRRAAEDASSVFKAAATAAQEDAHRLRLAAAAAVEVAETLRINAAAVATELRELRVTAANLSVELHALQGGRP